MNLFVVGVGALSGDLRGERALSEVLVDMPFGDSPARARWTGHGIMASMASHAPEQVGGVRYWAATDGRLAMFAGRPVARPAGEGPMFDGRSPLDPRWFASAPPGWASRMEGRFVTIGCAGDSGAVDVVTDPLGAYPVYEVEHEAVRWISNSAEVLRRLAPEPDAIDRGVLAEVLAGGWSLDGHAVWAGVRRIPAGWRAYRPEERPRDLPLLGLEEIARWFGAGLDGPRAAHTLTALTRALGDWPGRPSILPVTGGRDSRVVLAATRAAALDWPGGTAGPPDHPDAVIGRELCERIGRPFSTLTVPGFVDRTRAPHRAARMVRGLSGGTITLADAAGFPATHAPDPLPLWHTGQGGEIARGYYGAARGDGAGSLAGRLHAEFAGRAPGRREPLTSEATAAVRDRLRDWVEDALDAGVSPEDVPDAFYLLRRMGTWSAPGHGCVEPIRDATSPLWSRALLPDLLGAPVAERRRARFHREMVRALAPELQSIPFQDGVRWDGRTSGPARAAVGARRLRGRAQREIARRRAAGFAGTAAGAPGSGSGAATAAAVVEDPFGRLQRIVHDALRDSPWHSAWDVLDRRATEALLTTPPDGLDEMRRNYVWRIASVVLAD